MPAAWIERLFSRLVGFYGSKFADLWKGCDLKNVKHVWSEALGSYSPDEIKRGIDACLSRPFPPTLPEFLALCRPPLNYEAAYAEAVKQTRLRDEGRDEWSSAAVFWAAVEFGTFDLRNLTYASAKGRWAKCLDDAIKAVRDGSKPDQVPQRLAALPAPGKTTIPPEEAKRRIAEMAATLAGSKAMLK